MGWLIGTILLLIVGGIAVIAGKLAGPSHGEGTDESGGRVYANYWRPGAYGVAGLMGLGWVILTIASSIYIIDAGHVGVIKTFGSITGQTGDGASVVAPWSQVISVSTKAQRKEFDHLNAFSAETQDVFVDATLNLAVAPEDVQCLYRTVGSNWFDTLIPPRVLQTLKDETVKYSTVEVAPHREAIRRNVRARLQSQLENFRIRNGACVVKIDVQDFLLRNIDFRPEFKTAIERKQIATQDAQTARNRVAQAEYEASQVAAKAGGDARATLIKAQAQAKANRLLGASLTQEVISFAYVQKLAPTIHTIIAPSNSPFILPASVIQGRK